MSRSDAPVPPAARRPPRPPAAVEPTPPAGPTWAEARDAPDYRRFWPESRHLPSEPLAPEERWVAAAGSRLHVDRLPGSPAPRAPT